MMDAGVRAVGRLSLAIGVVAAGSPICLATYFALGGPFGTANDIGTATTAILSAVLAWSTRSQIPGRARDAAVGAAVLGSAIAVAGSALVISDTTGFFLAGLVSSVGFAGIGAWLIALNRSVRVSDWPRALRVVGVAAGTLMALGIVASPGIILQLDDMETAPAWIWLAEIGWLGIFVFYPAWAVWLGVTAIRQPRAALASVDDGRLPA